MQMKKLDFATLDIPSQKLAQFYNQHLAYRSAWERLGKEVPDMDEAGKRYARVLAWLEDRQKLADFDAIKGMLRKEFDSEARRLKLTVSYFGQDDSWINWDMAKQIFCLYALHIPYSTERYDIANPLENEKIRAEIVARHIGWEVYYSSHEGAWSRNPRVQELLYSSEYRSSKNETYGPAAWVLAEIGLLAQRTQS